MDEATENPAIVDWSGWEGKSLDHRLGYAPPGSPDDKDEVSCRNNELGPDTPQDPMTLLLDQFNKERTCLLDNST